MAHCLTHPSAGRYEEHDVWNRNEDEVPRGLGVPTASVSTDMTGDEAYQRRLAMSLGLQQSTPSVVAVDRNMSGDDAHARRSAISPGQPPYYPKETGDDAYQRRAAMSSTSPVPQLEPPLESPPLAYNPFAPVSVPSPPPGPPPSIEDQIARKREAAVAIAAKFSALAAVQPPEESIVAPQNPAQRYFPLSFNVTAALKGS
jgi:splicing factor 45